MTQYIDKAVAEVEIRKRLLPTIRDKHYDELEEGQDSERKAILGILDTIEVKEIDLTDSVKETLAQKYIDYTFKRHNIDPESKEGQLIYHAYMHGMNQCLTQLRIKDIK